MKLATLRSSTRDGSLIVVDRKLERAVRVPEIAPNLQSALDQWTRCSAQLEQVYADLNAGFIDNSQIFDPTLCAAPLPRAYQWLDGSAYVNHVELIRKTRGAEMPESFWHDPLMYQGASDDFIAATDDIIVASEDYGIDIEGETALITDDVPMGLSAESASQHIKLLVLVNDISFRQLIPTELAKGFGFLHGKPSTAFSPVALTPDELGDAWHDEAIHLALSIHINGELYGEPQCGVDMTFNFATLIAHAAKTRKLGAGTIIGSGTISNYDRSRGSACIAEQRMLETIEHGEAQSSFLKFGDSVRIEMFDSEGNSIFGAIEQTVTPIP